MTRRTPKYKGQPVPAQSSGPGTPVPWTRSNAGPAIRAVSRALGLSVDVMASAAKDSEK